MYSAHDKAVVLTWKGRKLQLKGITILCTFSSDHDEQESTESIFFPMTKLFQSKDEKLRRMMYLVIKELKVMSIVWWLSSGAIDFLTCFFFQPDSDCVIIVTSTLTKVMEY